MMDMIDLEDDPQLPGATGIRPTERDILVRETWPKSTSRKKDHQLIRERTMVLGQLTGHGLVQSRW